MPGPLEGLRVVEITSLGPGPFAAMVLADLGAEVVRVDRPGAGGGVFPSALGRGRGVVHVDLKDPAGVAALLDLIEAADVLVEGFRPGVAERLGLGPADCLARNPRLVYGRMTGWGQDGPLAQTAGHDIDYIAIAGALRHFARRDERPVAPMNLVGDFGGGSFLLVIGLLAAVLSARESGAGQVVDAAMVDGTALLMTMAHGFRSAGVFGAEPGTNLLDTGAPFYDVYRCADGGYLAVGALEPQFYAALLAGLGLGDDPDLPPQGDHPRWPELRARFTEVIAGRTRDEWAEVFAGTDACVAPVLHMDEAPSHPHNAARGTFVEVDGQVQPAPAPRFSGTPTTPPSAAVPVVPVLEAWGLDEAQITRLAPADPPAA